MFDLDTIMTTDLITTGADASLADARAIMREHRIRHLPVTNAAGECIGLLSSHDVLAATDSVLRNQDNRIHASEISVSDVMVTQIASVEKTAGIRQAALFLEKHKIGCLPVLEDGKLVGIITDTDFVGVAINLLEQLEMFEPESEEEVEAGAF